MRRYTAEILIDIHKIYVDIHTILIDTCDVELGIAGPYLGSCLRAPARTAHWPACCWCRHSFHRTSPALQSQRYTHRYTARRCRTPVACHTPIRTDVATRSFRLMWDMRPVSTSDKHVRHGTCAESRTWSHWRSHSRSRPMPCAHMLDEWCHCCSVHKHADTTSKKPHPNPGYCSGTHTYTYLDIDAMYFVMHLQRRSPHKATTREDYVSVSVWLVPLVVPQCLAWSAAAATQHTSASEPIRYTHACDTIHVTLRAGTHVGGAGPWWADGGPHDWCRMSTPGLTKHEPSLSHGKHMASFFSEYMQNTLWNDPNTPWNHENITWKYELQRSRACTMHVCEWPATKYESIVWGDARDLGRWVSRAATSLLPNHTAQHSTWYNITVGDVDGVIGRCVLYHTPARVCDAGMYVVLCACDAPMCVPASSHASVADGRVLDLHWETACQVVHTATGTPLKHTPHVISITHASGISQSRTAGIGGGRHSGCDLHVSGLWTNHISHTRVTCKGSNGCEWRQVHHHRHHQPCSTPHSSRPYVHIAWLSHNVNGRHLMRRKTSRVCPMTTISHQHQSRYCTPTFVATVVSDTACTQQQKHQRQSCHQHLHLCSHSQVYIHFHINLQSLIWLSYTSLALINDTRGYLIGDWLCLFWRVAVDLRPPGSGMQSDTRSQWSPRVMLCAPAPKDCKLTYHIVSCHRYCMTFVSALFCIVSTDIYWCRYR